MSSTYSPITILEYTHHTVTKHTSLTTCPVRTVLSLYYIPPPTYETHITDHMSSTYSPITILDPTTHLRNTQHWPHVQYVQSYHYIRSHHPVTITHIHWPHVQYVQSFRYITLDHMSSTLSPITILEHTSHIHNKQHWPHVQYIQSNHYIRTYVPHT